MKSYFSVIIPLYNKEKHIKNTIKSVLKQSISDFEIIVVNDGSTDESHSIVKTIEDKRIKIYNIENRGVSYARNFGIKKANANLIAFLDADDMWLNNHLQDLKELYEKYPDCGLYCKAYVKRLNNFSIKSIYKNIPKQVNWMGVIDDYFESSSINCIAWTSALAIPKFVLNDVEAFDEYITLGAGEDIDLWMKIALKYSVVFHNKVSAIHNLNAENRISNSNTNSRQFINLDKYEIFAKENKSLKTYLDLNRYAIAIQYKLVDKTEEANKYINKIDKSNLNNKQHFLIKQGSLFLKVMLLFKSLLRKFNINLSSYN